MNRDNVVSVIEGIGPEAERKLQALGIHCPCDLLRYRENVIHEAVADQASPEQVRHWRRAASLLQLDGMSAQWADALVRAGVDSIERVARAELSGLRALFAEALAQNLIPVAPTDDELADLLKDAVAIQHTGALRGTVVDRAGNPLPDISVRLGRAQTVTDPRGRFDLLRIPLGARPPLVLESDDQETMVFDAPPISPDVERIGVRVFRFTPGAGAKKPPPAVLSELAGDQLKGLAGLPIRTRMGEQADLRENDILMAREFDVRDELWRVVSKFKSLIHGELVVHAYTLPASLFEPPVNRGDLYRVVDGKPVRLDRNKLRLDHYKRWLRRRAATAELAAPVTDAEFRRYFAAQLEALTRQGGFSRVRRGGR